jgi:hypothetical protein
MKLTVIKDKDQKNIEVPNISRYANSQNKVSELDLSSNNPFFVQIENLSRKKYVPNPENKNHSLLWFFERTNGQYRETLNKLTTSQQKKFKEQNPSNYKFLKSDIAKFINAWELEPHFISQGSQKNFIHFTKKISDSVNKNKLPGENYYSKLIANAIMFKTIDQLFGRKGSTAIGENTNIKSFCVAYSLSLFHYLTENRFDLLKLYEDQKVDEYVCAIFKKLLIFVYNFFEENGGGMVSEYAKKASSWDKLKSIKYSENLLLLLKNYLISSEEKSLRDNEKEINSNSVDDSIYLISEIYKLGLKFWDGFLKYIQLNNIKEYDWNTAFDLVSKLKKQSNLNTVEKLLGKNVLKYVNANPDIIEKIKSLSKFIETDTIEIKFIFDRLSLISKEDWKRIIDLGSQTKLFDNLELSNIKTVQNSILRKEIIKEQSLIKAYDSIKKLSKFGFKI